MPDAERDTLAARLAALEATLADIAWRLMWLELRFCLPASPAERVAENLHQRRVEARAIHDAVVLALLLPVRYVLHHRLD